MAKEGRVFSVVFGASLAALVIGMMLPAQPEDYAADLPWEVRPADQGGSRVFGLTLGRSTLSDAEKKLGADAQLSLFLSPKGVYSLEGYFDQVILAGLHARVVLGLAVSQEGLATMFDRSVRVSTLGDGTRKAILHSGDRVRMERAVIAHLTYIPAVRLSADLVARRFGEPASRIREPDQDTVHWLYPHLGVDIALDGRDHAVLQYVPPGEFFRLSGPLMERGGAPP